jgi:hypothetical protein
LADRGARHRRTALFVDFENVHRKLSAASEVAGDRFATDPARWVRWIEQDLGPLLVEDDQDAPRSVLRRVCYLDPAGSSRHRPYFTRAGFRVVDCPSLTGFGKNSADIHMVLDILDTLTHPGGYDEFIVLSADADFTPVLLRLREHDRRTAMLVSGPTAAALRASCDYAIPEEVFLVEALGVDDSPRRPLPSRVTTTSADSQPQEAIDTTDLRRRMEDVVRATLAAADEPLDLATVAHRVRQVVGQIAKDTDWGGTGSFSHFLATIADDTLQVDLVPSPGRLLDPSRHQNTLVHQAADLPPEIRETAARVNQILDVPLLPSGTYAAAFRALTESGRTVAPAGQNQVERTVRDACASAGAPLARSAIHFILLGYRSAGYDWTRSDQKADDLAAAFADNVVRLAANAQMDLDGGEQDRIRTWITAAMA